MIPVKASSLRFIFCTGTHENASSDHQISTAEDRLQTTEIKSDLSLTNPIFTCTCTCTWSHYVKSQQTRLTRSDRGASTQTEGAALQVTLAGHPGGPRRSCWERRSLLLLPVSTHSASVAPMQKDQTHSQLSVNPHCPLLAHTCSVRMDLNTVELLVEEQNTPSAQQTNQNRENVDIQEDLNIKQAGALYDGGGGPTAGEYWGGALMEREDELIFRPGIHSSLHNQTSVSDERRNEQMNGGQRALTAPPPNPRLTRRTC